MATVVLSGTWRYDGSIAALVEVFTLPYDFWYEVARAEDDLQPGETPHLNADGECFYYRIDRGFHTGSRGVGVEAEARPWPDGGPCLSLQEARVAAEATLPSHVTWGPEV